MKLLIAAAALFVGVSAKPGGIRKLEKAAGKLSTSSDYFRPRPERFDSSSLPLRDRTIQFMSRALDDSIG